jgi:hypothetical protein
MYEELYRYFIQNKKLALPGIGTLLLQRRPAESDFVNKRINPPSYSVVFQTVADSPSLKFFKWLGAAFLISDHAAIIRFNDFVFDLKKQISDGNKINWKGVGILNKGLAGEVKFTPAAISAIENPITAEKVIREKAEHFVRVGEDERTSVEMTELLSKTEVKKSSWLLFAITAVLLSLMFIGWYLSKNGVDVSSTSNTMKLVPMEASAPYQKLP